MVKDVTEKLESVDLSSESQKTGLEKDVEDGDDAEEEHEEEEEVEDDDGGGWITPSNLKQVQMDVGHSVNSANVKVGCVTTDFAMQVCSV